MKTSKASGNPVSDGPELVRTAMENKPAQLLDLPFELKDSVGRLLSLEDAKALSGTCRVWRDVLVPVIFRRVKLGSSPEVGRGLVMTDYATESKIFSRTYQQLRHLADDKATPILSSVRLFNFCVTENALAPYKLAIPYFYGEIAERMAREYFAAMPQLVLLQGVEYDRGGGGSGPITMARRTERVAADSSSDARDTFRMGFVAPSHALERFQRMAGGDGAVAEERLYETLTDEEFTL
ncbi:hypothetical protein CMUS01_13819 [Colletotrichum musicola]|uniref:F-box domain-containing protein n=1 Tax=Colletotrichum musicola TaxID=2175873 RepID=A0A8H6MTV2_9PEZI|nr:hypothetical protein CMUS01_13819 [Colletotrichum musicola]